MDSGEKQARPDVTIRTELRPGDLGQVVHLHGVVYAREYGFDATFEAHVAGPLSEFASSATDRERIWLAEDAGRLVGCVAIVASSPDVAQLRWFLVDPAARGRGLGRKLLVDAVRFCRTCGYQSVILWTVDALAAAAHLYRSAGFTKVEQTPARRWGVDVIEQRYVLHLEES